MAANVFGLALALSICTIGYFNYRSNATFNTYFEKAGDLYKIHGLRTGEATLGRTALALGPTLQSAGIEATRYTGRSLNVKKGTYLFNARIGFADPNFLDLFPFEDLQGNPVQMPSGNEILISEKLALKLFDEAYPIGKLVKMAFPNKKEESFIVKEVFAELPTNTSFGQEAILPISAWMDIYNLEEGDWVEVRADGATVHDHTNEVVERPIKKTAVDGAMIGKGDYRHFMLKEIYEQPAVVGDTLHALINPSDRTIALPHLPVDPVALPRLTIVACGTSFYAGMIAKYWFEKYARLPVEIDVASEFRYREPPVTEGTVALFVSQSGETADTLSSLRYCKENGLPIASIVNVQECSRACASNYVFPSLAGPEIGVASTKAFTCQLSVLASLAIGAGVQRGLIDIKQRVDLADGTIAAPAAAHFTKMQADSLLIWRDFH